jgi:hypothetical protein
MRSSPGKTPSEPSRVRQMVSIRPVPNHLHGIIVLPDAANGVMTTAACVVAILSQRGGYCYSKAASTSAAPSQYVASDAS